MIRALLTHAKHLKAMIGDRCEARRLPGDILAEFFHRTRVDVLRSMATCTDDVVMIVRIIA